MDILCALGTEILGTLEEENAITEGIDRSSEFLQKLQEAIFAIENYFEQVKNDRRDSLRWYVGEIKPFFSDFSFLFFLHFLEQKSFLLWRN